MGLRINFGCGRRILDGFFNIDAVRNPRAPRDPDLIYAATFTDGRLDAPVPLENGCAAELHALHMIEHVYAWEALALVREWHRLIVPGGLLVVECPNIELSARNLIEGQTDQMSMWGLYGDPSHRDPFMCHRWGYTPKTLRALLEEGGFGRSKAMAPRTHKARDQRDMRMEAIRL